MWACVSAFETALKLEMKSGRERESKRERTWNILHTQHNGYKEEDPLEKFSCVMFFKESAGIAKHEVHPLKRRSQSILTLMEEKPDI